MNRASSARVLIMLLGVALLARVALACRPGLWGDEIFSLAMATGHSLEHPAAAADPASGDFVEPRTAVPSTTFRRYAEHDSPPATAGRVVRAVLISDTNPPLYYLLLNGWTRLLGTSDAALHFNSVFWALLALPLIALLGRELGGARAGWTAAILFAFSPVSLFYSIEGRMYSLLWLLAAALALASLRLRREGLRPMGAAAWILAATGGLLTHYFFVFVFAGMLFWLACAPGRVGRAPWALLAAVTVALVAPWYVEVPASLVRWRVTGHWLAQPLPWPQSLAIPPLLGWRLLAGGSIWGGSGLVDGGLALAYLALGVRLLVRGQARPLFSAERLLLWAWLAAAVVGPFAFDILRHTSASRITRYALPGLPAALLLVALAVGQLRGRAHTAFVALILAAWSAGAWPIFVHRARPGAAYRALDASLAARSGPGDLVLVHSVPSGVIGTARYLRRPLSMASWIAPLGVRQVPRDLELLLRGRHRVALVQVHNLAQPAPAYPWLQAHARLVRREIYNGDEDYMMVTDTTTFAPAALDALRNHQMVEIFYFEPTSDSTFLSAER